MNKWTFLVLIVVAIGTRATVSGGGCKKACGNGKCVVTDGYEVCECGLPYYGESCEKGGATIAAYLFGGIGALFLVLTVIFQIIDHIRGPPADEEVIEMETKADGKSLPEGKTSEKYGKVEKTGKTEKNMYLNLELPENVYEQVGQGGAQPGARPAGHSTIQPSAPPVQRGMVLEEDCYVDLQGGRPEVNVYEQFK